MNELGLTLDGPKPLKGMLNVLGSNAAVPEGGEKFATVLENRVQANLSHTEATEDGAEPVITQSAAKLSWTPMSDETEETEIITNQPLDPIVAAKISADPSMPNVEKAATQEPIYLDAQKLLAELDHLRKSSKLAELKWAEKNKVSEHKIKTLIEKVKNLEEKVATKEDMVLTLKKDLDRNAKEITSLMA